MSENIIVYKEMFVEELNKLLKVLYQFAYKEGDFGYRSAREYYGEKLTEVADLFAKVCGLSEYSFIIDDDSNFIFCANSVIEEKEREEQRRKEERKRKQEEKQKYVAEAWKDLLTMMSANNKNEDKE